MTGEGFGYKLGVAEQAKFEYSALGKVFNKGLEKEDQEGLLKRLKNIESKNKGQLKEIECQGERQLDMINKQGKKQLKAIKKQEDQPKKSKIKKQIEQEEKQPGEVILLKDSLNNILMNFDVNFTKKGDAVLKNVANDERMINYNNLFFKTGNSFIDNFDFLKRFGTLCDLLFDLLSGKISIKKKEQNEMLIKQKS